MERLAESVNGGEMRVEGCEGEMGRVMDFVGVDEETVEWKEEREWRSDAVLVPMFRRVRAFKKAQVRLIPSHPNSKFEMKERRVAKC